MKNVSTFGKLLLLFCLPLLLTCIKTTSRNVLARPVMGTIFLVINTIGLGKASMLSAFGESTQVVLQQNSKNNIL